MGVVVFIVVVFIITTLAEASFLGDVKPYSFSEGDVVPLKVNKMTSSKTLLPIDYYRMPFCQPDEGVHMDRENMGEILAGDRIESSPYRLYMKQDMYCEQLCISNVGSSSDDDADKKKKKSNNNSDTSKLIRAIRKDYHNNWIVDNLSSASKVEDEATITMRYWNGFPIGYISDGEDDRTQKAYLYNHVNIEIMYHTVLEKDEEKYRIVRFVVEPLSIQHKFESDSNNQEENVGDGNSRVKMINPIASCNNNNKRANVHTDYNMISSRASPQPADGGKVLFTYDVTWIENPELSWSSRWDIYLSMDGAIPANVHWLSVLNSLIMDVVLSVMVAAILIRNLRRDFARYNRGGNVDEEAANLEDFGWKLVHANVFRPPTTFPLLFSVACGTGAQLCCMSLFVILFSCIGFLSPANRGSLLMAELLLYIMMGSIAGYVSARLYKTFAGAQKWQLATYLTANAFPGTCFAAFFFMDLLALGYGSTDAVPILTIFQLLMLWFGISTPLVFFGAYFGYLHEPIRFPVVTSKSIVPRPIPDQPWFLSTSAVLAVGGVLPFGAIFIELYFLLASVWMEQYYHVYGILLLVYVVLIITCAEITLLLNYFSMCRENYRWWWRSFWTGGSVAIYVFLYSIYYYYTQLKEAHKSFATFILYFGYMGLVSLSLYLMMGFVGVASCLWFNRKIFSSIKID